MNVADTSASTRGSSRELWFEIVSGGSGLALALFMWGHMFLVGTILFGERGFDWLAGGLEKLYIAQPTIVIIFILFLVHAVFASRKIPLQLRERKAMMKLAGNLRAVAFASPNTAAPSVGTRPHLESWLWIWQVRTGMVMLILGTAHLVLITVDIFTPMFGEVAGIEASSSMARVREWLMLPYAVLLLCVEFHAGVGLYRLAVKWGFGAKLSRAALWRIEKLIFWTFLGLGIVILLVLAAWLPPPFAFMLE
ncbi:MAG: hypothetical protein HKN70_15215 [Gammaproteobacteria bacterium]|nr:hypothetical protein [Gammaproteobacteria bacterium]